MAHPALESDEDAALARRILACAPARDAAAETELCRRLGPRIRLYALKHLRNEAAAADLMQDILIMTLEKLRAGALREPERLASFVLGTARQMVVDGRRNRARRERILEAFPLDLLPDDPTTKSDATDALDGERLRGCLEALPERERAVLVMTFYDDRPADAVGSELGLSAGNVRVIRHRGIERLRGCMSLKGRCGMTRNACAAHGSQELLAYWLGEIDEATEARLDEHLIACAECSARLRALVDLGAAVRRELLRGTFGSVLPPRFVRSLKEGGLRVREYDLEAGGSVNCTITPDDDLLVAHLHAPLRGVRRVDLVFHDPAAGMRHRANDIAFDPATNEIAFVPNAAYVRTLGHARQHVRLLAVDGVEERVIADYTFNHSPS